MKSYHVCSKCVMDTSDPNISFDDQGVCDYCRNFETQILPNWHTDERGNHDLCILSDRIKTRGKGKDFDCIIGLSGGLDSSYAAYIAKQRMGLRPLLYHVDAGWNTEQAVSNIEKLVNALDLDLYTDVINWEEMKLLQVAFLRSQIADQDFPQDAAFFSSLYLFARRNGIKYVLTGANYSTECCREPEEWGAYPGIDKTLLNDICKRHGDVVLESFPVVDILKYKLYYQVVLGMQIVKPLNFLPYIKKEAEEDLFNFCGWQKFKHKHHESRFTRFYEDYWLPRKFGFHKRRAHFSSLIMTGQMTRKSALERLSRPEMEESFLIHEFEFVAHKLGLTVDELQKIFDAPNSFYNDYKNKRWFISRAAKAMRFLGLEKRLFR